MNYKKQSALFVVALGVLALLLSGCSTSSTGDIPNRTPVLWSLPIQGFGPSALVGDTIVGYGKDTGDGDYFVAVDLKTRQVKWQSEGLKGALSQQDMVGTKTHWYLHRFNASALETYRADGTLTSAFDYPNFSEGNTFGLNPIVDGNTLLVGSGIYLYGFDLSNPDEPELAWTYTAPSWLTDLVVDEQGNIYMGVQLSKGEDNLFKLSREDRSVLWAANTYTDVVREQSQPDSMILSESKLFVNAFGSTQAFDVITGERLWTTRELLCDETYAPGYVLDQDDKRIFQNSGRCVFAIEKATGDIVWRFYSEEYGPKGYTFSNKPTYYNGVVYAFDSQLWAIDAETGKALSFSNEQKLQQLATYIHVYDGKLVTWDRDVTVYEPVR